MFLRTCEVELRLQRSQRGNRFLAVECVLRRILIARSISRRCPPHRRTEVPREPGVRRPVGRETEDISRRCGREGIKTSPGRPRLRSCLWKISSQLSGMEIKHALFRVFAYTDILLVKLFYYLAQYISILSPVCHGIKDYYRINYSNFFTEKMFHACS